VGKSDIEMNNISKSLASGEKLVKNPVFLGCAASYRSGMGLELDVELGLTSLAIFYAILGLKADIKGLK